MAGPVDVCSRSFCASSPRPERAAEADRSMLSEDGGVRTPSVSAPVRRWRSRLGGRRAVEGVGTFGFVAAAVRAPACLAVGRVVLATRRAVRFGAARRLAAAVFLATGRALAAR